MISGYGFDHSYGKEPTRLSPVEQSAFSSIGGELGGNLGVQGSVGTSNMAGRAFASQFGSSLVKNLVAQTALGTLMGNPFIGLTNIPATLGSSIKSGTVAALKTETPSITGTFAKVGQRLMKLGVSALGLTFGPLGAFASLGVGLVGGYLGDVVGDVFNSRSYEGLRDELEDRYGSITGRSTFNKITQDPNFGFFSDPVNYASGYSPYDIDYGIGRPVGGEGGSGPGIGDTGGGDYGGVSRGDFGGTVGGL